ncbi:RAP protein, putative [Plasmodium ovale curtisi]|uniref:RAP protein, putative n=1 Tax=Plasmodium ovale curtisi TaxID=864141 RepID=A0A1A8VV20_PLAOA|nr:RAP protein, putative [Plasmodium ovale curtisi]
MTKSGKYKDMSPLLKLEIVFCKYILIILVVVPFLLTKSYYIKKRLTTCNSHEILSVGIRDVPFMKQDKGRKVRKEKYDHTKKIHKTKYNLFHIQNEKKPLLFTSWANLAGKGKHVREKEDRLVLTSLSTFCRKRGGTNTGSSQTRVNGKWRISREMNDVGNIEGVTHLDGMGNVGNIGDVGEQVEKSEMLSEQTKTKQGGKKGRRKNYVFAPWNNPNEMNNFNIEKYNLHNESPNEQGETHAYHSANYSARRNSSHVERNESSGNTTSTNVKINQELVNALSVQDLLNVLRKYNNTKSSEQGEKIFNEVNLVTAYHRIAKHVKNKSFLSNGRTHEGDTLGSCFDPVTSSLFENYASVGSELEYAGSEQRWAPNMQADEAMQGNNAQTDEARQGNNAQTDEARQGNNAQTDEVGHVNNAQEESLLRGNHDNLYTIDIYRDMYELMKRRLIGSRTVVPKHVANIAWASAILSNKDVDLWMNIKKRFYENLNNFKAQEISIILWSFGASKKEPVETEEEFLFIYDCIKKNIQEHKFKAQEFSNIIWAFAVSNCCSYNLIILLYNYALEIYEKLLLKDVSTILYSLSLFASDCINMDILNVIKESHLTRYGIGEDYLTVDRQKGAAVGSVDESVDDKNEGGRSVHGNDSPTKCYVPKFDDAQKGHELNEKKYTAFLLFENFLTYSLKKIVSEREKMTMRTWANIFWACANVGLGLYSDECPDHALSYYVYVKGGGKGTSGETSGVRGQDIAYRKEGDSMYYLPFEGKSLNLTDEHFVQSTEVLYPSADRKNLFLDFKPYVHCINGSYVFPLKCNLDEEKNPSGEDIQMADRYDGIDVDLDLFNRGGNIIKWGSSDDRGDVNDQGTDRIVTNCQETDRIVNNDPMESWVSPSSHGTLERHNTSEKVTYLEDMGKEQSDIIYKRVDDKFSEQVRKSRKDNFKEGENGDVNSSKISNLTYVKFANVLNGGETNVYCKRNKNIVVHKLMKSFELQLKEKMIKWGKCEIQSIANILWSLSILNIFSKFIFENGLYECNKRFIKCGKKKKSTKLQYFISQLHQSQLYQAAFSYSLYMLNKENGDKKMEKKEKYIVKNNYMKNFILKKKIQRIFEKYFKVSINTLNIWKKQLARNQRKEEKNKISSSVHKKISNDLKQLGISHYSEYFILDSILVDMYLPCEKIAIEIDGPSHFFQRGKFIVYKPNSIFKKRLLRAMGFVVLSISISDHTFMFSGLRTTDFVRRFLSRVNWST